MSYPGKGVIRDKMKSKGLLYIVFIQQTYASDTTSRGSLFCPHMSDGIIIKFQFLHSISHILAKVVRYPYALTLLSIFQK